MLFHFPGGNLASQEKQRNSKFFIFLAQVPGLCTYKIHELIILCHDVVYTLQLGLIHMTLHTFTSDKSTWWSYQLERGLTIKGVWQLKRDSIIWKVF